jgi:hypothetical protein
MTGHRRRSNGSRIFDVSPGESAGLPMYFPKYRADPFFLASAARMKIGAVQCGEVVLS